MGIFLGVGTNDLPSKDEALWWWRKVYPPPGIGFETSGEGDPPDDVKFR